MGKDLLVSIFSSTPYFKETKKWPARLKFSVIEGLWDISSKDISAANWNSFYFQRTPCDLSLHSPLITQVPSSPFLLLTPFLWPSRHCPKQYWSLRRYSTYYLRELSAKNPVHLVCFVGQQSDELFFVKLRWHRQLFQPKSFQATQQRDVTDVSCHQHWEIQAELELGFQRRGSR